MRWATLRTWEHYHTLCGVRSDLKVCQGALKPGVLLSKLLLAVDMVKLQPFDLLHCSLVLSLHCTDEQAVLGDLSQVASLLSGPG